MAWWSSVVRACLRAEGGACARAHVRVRVVVALWQRACALARCACVLGVRGCVCVGARVRACTRVLGVAVRVTWRCGL